ncbi:hypothetical protein [Bacillus paranthracis]|uniref:hypothetical protein n=2 Tax=Bacillus paranthracis TaxID=2026186 RepID=UPI0029C20E00|nr:hypothetical protein [Bacillus paranthracis]MCM0006128.1 hypothetical protein [Bacillus paranthracis]MDX6046760.1 hypothetical protein [Bacillus paranthracis]
MDNIKTDKLIAKHVMELHDFSTEDFSPSTNMNHTLLVMKRLKMLGFSVLLRDCANEDCGLVRNEEATRDDYYCNVSIGSVYNEKLWYKSIAKTPQMAVCLSALKAIGVIDNE